MGRLTLRPILSDLHLSSACWVLHSWWPRSCFVGSVSLGLSHVKALACGPLDSLTHTYRGQEVAKKGSDIEARVTRHHFFPDESQSVLG